MVGGITEQFLTDPAICKEQRGGHTHGFAQIYSAVEPLNTSQFEKFVHANGHFMKDEMLCPQEETGEFFTRRKYHRSLTAILLGLKPRGLQELLEASCS